MLGELALGLWLGALGCCAAPPPGACAKAVAAASRAAAEQRHTVLDMRIRIIRFLPSIAGPPTKPDTRFNQSAMQRARRGVALGRRPAQGIPMPIYLNV